MFTQIQGCAPSRTHACAPTSAGARLRAKHRPLQALGSHGPPGSPARQHCDDRTPKQRGGPAERPRGERVGAAPDVRSRPGCGPAACGSTHAAAEEYQLTASWDTSAKSGPARWSQSSREPDDRFLHPATRPPRPRSTCSFLRDFPRHLGLKSTVLPLRRAPPPIRKGCVGGPWALGGLGQGRWGGGQPCLRKRGVLQLSPRNSSGSEKWSFHGRSRERH